MSKFTAAIVLLCQSVATLAAYPNDPKPRSLVERVTDAAKAVSLAAEEPGQGLEGGAAVDIGALVDHLAADPAFAEALVTGLAGSEAFLTALSVKLVSSGELKSALDEIVLMTGPLHERLEKLEDFAGKVSGDIGPRLEALEKASAPVGEAEADADPAKTKAGKVKPAASEA